MIKAVLGIYWKWRVFSNQGFLIELLQLRKDCSNNPELLKEVDGQIDQLNHLINQAELQLLKYKTVTA